MTFPRLKKKQMRCFLPVLIIVASSSCYANDLNDGISIDTPINDDLTLDPNIDYLKRSAIAEARRDQKNGKNTGCGGAGNQTFGAGTNLQGATIINLSNNKGAKAICIKR